MPFEQISSARIRSGVARARDPCTEHWATEPHVCIARPRDWTMRSPCRIPYFGNFVGLSIKVRLFRLLILQISGGCVIFGLFTIIEPVLPDQSVPIHQIPLWAAHLPSAITRTPDSLIPSVFKLWHPEWSRPPSGIICFMYLFVFSPKDC